MIRLLLARLTPYAWWGAACGFAVLLLALGAQTLRLEHARAAVAELQAGWAQDRANAAAAAVAKAAEYRAEEQRRAAAQLEAIEHAEQQAARARADAAIADAAAGRLRARVDALVAAARAAASNPQAATPGPAAEDPAGMLADVLGRCVARVRQLADLADQRGTAGSTCERAYDSLTPPAEPE